MRQPRVPREYYEMLAGKNDGGSVLVLYFARRAEAERNIIEAERCYRKYRTMTKDDQYLRDFLYRQHRFVALIEETPAEQRDELQRIGNAAIACHEFKMAIDAFKKYDDKKGLRRVFNAAVRRADSVIISLMEKDGFAFGKPEQLACGNAMIRKPCATDEILAFINDHELQKELGAELINALITDDTQIEEIDECARRLDLVLTKKQLLRLYEVARGDEMGIHSSCAVESARRLAALDDRWKKKLPQILRWARNVQLNWGDIRSAEAYGQECGHPLTIEELFAIQNELPEETDTKALEGWEREKVAVVRALIVEREKSGIASLSAREPEEAAR
ncbi:hypothetical protein HY625_02160 [Candidatus Uhrbacteria bacterium]|nr:hypothetical protein [Candidatus Uhrbacteria bacterium]